LQDSTIQDVLRKSFVRSSRTGVVPGAAFLTEVNVHHHQTPATVIDPIKRSTEAVMNELQKVWDGFVDALKRRFWVTYLVPAEKKRGGKPPKKHDWRRCPHCSSFVSSMDIGNRATTTSVQLCNECGNPLWTRRDHTNGTRLVYVQNRRGGGHNTYVLERPLYNPFWWWGLMGAALMWLGAILLFDTHDGLVVFHSTLAAQGLGTATQTDDVRNPGMFLSTFGYVLIAWVSWLAAIGRTWKKFSLGKHGFGQRHPLFAIPVLNLLAVLFLVGLYGNPTFAFTNDYTVMEDEQAVRGHFYRKVDGEVGELVEAGTYVEALELLAKAQHEWGDRADWDLRRAQVVIKATSADPFALEEPVVINALRLRPADLATAYDAYLGAVLKERGSDAWVTACKYDPLNVFTPYYAHEGAWEAILEQCAPEVVDMARTGW